MQYLVKISYQKFLIPDGNTARSFAELAKASIIGDSRDVEIEILTDEEAAEYEKRD